MSQFRLARLCLMLAAVGLTTPALMTGAHAQQKSDAPAPAAAPQPDTVRPEMFKLLDPAQIQPLMTAKNFAEVQNRIAQAEALPNLTPYEQFVLNRMRVALGVATNNNAMTLPAMEAVLASGRLQPAERLNFIEALATTHFNAKNYPKAIEYFKLYQAEGGAPEKVRRPIGVANYLNKDYAAAKDALAPYVADLERAGKVPSDEDLRLLASSAIQAKDDKVYLLALEKLVTHYPSDDYWIDVLSRGVMRQPGFDPANDVNVLRLGFAAAKQLEPQWYVDLAELALKDGFPTEAKNVLDAGYEAGVMGKGSDAKPHNALRARANKGAADDAKTIASGEAGAKKSKSGAGLVNLGWAYVTMGQYDKGIDFIQQGIAKGGLKQPDEAKLRLGMAYARAGRKDEAVKTFESVKAGGGLSDLAKYWIVLVNQQQQPAAAGGAATASAQ